MFQTFSKAWGIKPKALLLKEEKKVHGDLSKEDSREVPETKQEPLNPSKIQDSKEPLEKGKIQKEILGDERSIVVKQVEKGEEKQGQKKREIIHEKEVISLEYHKYIIFLLFIINILSLVVILFLVLK
jgi:hypothetical protein